MHEPQIRVHGLKDPAKFEDYGSHCLVDVMSIVGVGADTVDIIADNPEHVRNDEDREWLRGILKDILILCDEGQATVVFL